MKKSLLLLALSAMVIGGCSKSEIDEGSINSSNAISFSTSSNKQTKAAVLDNDNVEEYEFGLYGYYTGQDSWASHTPTTPDFMFNQKVDYVDGAWTYDPIKYWPNTTNDKISFFAYMPMSNGNDIRTAVVDNMPVVKFEQTMTPYGMKDLVVAQSLDNTKQSTAVKLSFEHVLTRLNFAAKVDKDLADGTKIEVTGLKILGTKNSIGVNTAVDNSSVNEVSRFFSYATYSFSADGTGGSWSEDDSNTQVEDAMEFSSLLNAGVEITGVEAQQLLTDGQYLFLIPPYGKDGVKAATDVRIQVDYTTTTGGFSSSATDVFSMPNGSLVEGKAYNVVLTFGVEEVQVAAVMNLWATEEDVYSVTVGEAQTAGEINSLITTALDESKDVEVNYGQNPSDALAIAISTSKTSNSNTITLNLINQTGDVTITTCEDYEGLLIINAPNATVTVDGGTYTNIISTTAPKTLKIAAGTTVDGLTIKAGNVTVYGTLTGTIYADDDLGTSYITVMDGGDISKATIDNETKIIINSTADYTTGVYFSLDGGAWTLYTGTNGYSGDYSDDINNQINGTVTSYKSIKIRTFGSSTIKRGMLHSVYANTELTHVDLSEATFSSDEYYVSITPEKTKLEEFIIPKNITVLNGGFYNASTLKRVVLSDGIEQINGGSFRNCTSLTEVVNLDKVKTINGSWSGAFQNCTSLTSVDLSSLEEVVDVIREDGSLCWAQTFYDCTNLKKVILSDKLKTIACGMFTNCSSLESIDLKNVDKVNICAFQDCTSLTNVDLSKVTTFEEAAFRYSALGNDVAKTLNTSIEEIPLYMFSGWGNLTEYEIPANIKRIAGIAFSYTSIVDVHIPATVEEITGISIFYILPSVLDARLTITIDPDCPVKYWPEQTFNHNNYKEIDFPVATEELGTLALNNNKYLSEITLRNPDMVVKCIEENTFGSVTDEGINYLVGSQCDADTKKVLYVPADLVDDYQEETITVEDEVYDNQWYTVLVKQCGFTVEAIQE